MYKSTLALAIVFGTLSFTLSENGTMNEVHSEKTEALGSPDMLVFDKDQKGNKENKGAKQNQPNSNQKGAKKDKKNGKQTISFDLKPGKKGNKGNKHSDNGNPSSKGKQAKGNKPQGKAKDQKSAGKKGKNQQGNTNYKKAIKGKNGKFVYSKGHPNFRYVYVNQHGVYSHKNFGQWRSEQARNKHKNYSPIYEYEALAGFSLIISRNNFLYTETNYKINLLNVRLKEKRSSGGITLVQYNTYVNRIEVLQKRRAVLEINLTL